MVVFENAFVIFEAEEQNGILIETFKPATADMTSKDWKESQLKLKEVFLEHKVDKILCFGKEFYFIVTPSLQEWQSTKLTANISKLKKMAIIMPKDFVTQLSVEQLMEEKNTAKINTKYFDNEPQARAWLME